MQTDATPEPPVSEPVNVRKPYECPKLEEHGTISVICGSGIGGDL
jgi:hypothetical protein